MPVTVGVYVKGKKIDEVCVYDDYEEAWEHVSENLDFKPNDDGTLKVFYKGKVILEAYKPDFDLSEYDIEEDYEDIKERLYEELTQWSNVIYLVEL